MNLNMPDWVEWGNFFFTAQAGQRQAYLDARKPENRKQVYQLVEEGDVFVENLRPGVADAEGYSAIRAIVSAQLPGRRHSDNMGWIAPPALLTAFFQKERAKYVLLSPRDNNPPAGFLTF
ncbi:MAG: CoA transferase [Planctomycetaceae bacterium]|nr:CoA transferase [Planctomycetaceae bacterium]